MDRCDIPLIMFYVSSNFDPNATKLAKCLKDNEYYEDRPWHRTCQITLDCDVFIEWKKMQIVGNTPDETKILEMNFNNSVAELDKSFSTNV